MKRELTIATPCYNEAAALPTYFERIDFVRARLTEKGWTHDLILIDDGSKDETPRLLEQYARARQGVSVVRHPRNLGYGGAIKTALALADKEWVVFVDSDTNYDQAIILELADLAGDGVDLLDVSIFAPGGSSDYGAHRRLLSQSASLIYRLVVPRLTRGIYTMTCGFRWYRSAVAPKVFPRRSTYVATSEIMLRALRAGLRVVEVPASNHPRRHGFSKMKFVRESLAHLRLAARALFGALGSPLPIEEHRRLIGR